MKWQYNDGGRKSAGYKGTARDCVCRAISIATERPYDDIYNLINYYAAKERPRNGKRSNARQGVFKQTIRRVMAHLGWEWVPTMQIGSGCKVHLADGELPMGRLVVSVSRHETAVIDGVINDTHDCSRDGSRCVYGYYRAGDKAKIAGSPAKTLSNGEQASGGVIMPPALKPRKRLQMARYTQGGDLVLTAGYVKRQALSMIPDELRPYYIGCIIDRIDDYEPMTAWNSDITLQFTKPVCSFGDRREIHASLEDLGNIMADLYIDPDDDGTEYAEYDEEITGRKPIRIPDDHFNPAEAKKWHEQRR